MPPYQRCPDNVTQDSSIDISQKHHRAVSTDNQLSALVKMEPSSHPPVDIRSMTNPALAAAFGKLPPADPSVFLSDRPSKPTPVNIYSTTAHTLQYAEDSTQPIKPDARFEEGRCNTDLACDQCRTGRKRCGGRQPFCETCDDEGIACSYNDLPRKRGVSTGYIRGMQKLLGLAIQGGLEDRLKELWDNAMATPSDREAFMRIWHKDIKDNEFEALWRDSEIHGALRELLKEVHDDDEPTVIREARKASVQASTSIYSQPASVPPPPAHVRTPQLKRSSSLINYVPKSPDLSEYY